MAHKKSSGVTIAALFDGEPVQSECSASGGEFLWFIFPFHRSHGKMVMAKHSLSKVGSDC
jgi:hypothetical protein